THGPDGAGEVDLDHPGEVLVGGVFDPAVHADARVGDEGVEAAEALHSRRDERAARLRAAHVELDRERTVLADLGNELLEPVHAPTGGGTSSGAASLPAARDLPVPRLEQAVDREDGESDHHEDESDAPDRAQRGLAQQLVEPLRLT